MHPWESMSTARTMVQKHGDKLIAVLSFADWQRTMIAAAADVEGCDVHVEEHAIPRFAAETVRPGKRDAA